MGTLLSALLLTAAWPAWAGDPMTDAMVAAYAPYRAALFRTNGQDAAAAADAVAQGRRAWQAVQAQFAARPPAPYERDPEVARTLAGVDAAFAQAEAAVAAGRLPAAHEALEAVRDLLSDLRRRNQVIVYSDHVNAFHAEMEHLLGGAPALLERPQGAQEVLARAAALAGDAGAIRAALAPVKPAFSRFFLRFG
ncbi:MAG: hypothetical protein Fur0014_01680 [Rubrivivax sp.]